MADERKRMEVDKKNLIINLIKINKLTFQEIAEITPVELSYIRMIADQM